MSQTLAELQSLLLQERAQCAKLHNDIAALKQSQSQELAAVWSSLKLLESRDEQSRGALLAREQQWRKQLEAAQVRAQGLAAQNTRLQQANQRLPGLEQQVLKQALELSAAKASFEQARKKAAELQSTVASLRAEHQRTAAELERVQGEVLERDHLRQLAVMELRDLQKDGATHQESLHSLQNTLNGAQGELQKAGERLAIEKRRREHAEEAIRQAELEHDRLRAALDVAEKRLSLRDSPYYDLERISRVALPGRPIND